MRQADGDTARIRVALVTGAAKLDQCEDVLVVEQFPCAARGCESCRKCLHFCVFDSAGPLTGTPEIAELRKRSRGPHGRCNMRARCMARILWARRLERNGLAYCTGARLPAFLRHAIPASLESRDFGPGARVRLPSRARPARYSRWRGMADAVGPCGIFFPAAIADTCSI